MIEKGIICWDGHLFFDRRTDSQRVGLHQHCRGGSGNGEGFVLCFSSSIFGVTDSPPRRQMTLRRLDLI